MRLELGKLAEDIGKPEIAATWYQAVLTIDSQNQQALLALERVIGEITRQNNGYGPFRTDRAGKPNASKPTQSITSQLFR